MGMDKNRWAPLKNPLHTCQKEDTIKHAVMSEQESAKKRINEKE